jgi:hypothetical protein
MAKLKAKKKARGGGRASGDVWPDGRPDGISFGVLVWCVLVYVDVPEPLKKKYQDQIVAVNYDPAVPHSIRERREE